METKDIFQINFKRLRQRKGISQKQVAEELTIAPQSVSKWERGECLPSLGFLPDLAGILSCHIGEFFMEIPDDDEARTKVEELLYVTECIDKYNETVGDEREKWKDKYWQACIRLFEFERVLFIGLPLDEEYLSFIVKGTHEQIETLLEWLYKEGVLGKFENKYYLINCKYSALLSEMVVKRQ